MKISLSTRFIESGIIILPCFVTITLETASGTLVPAARNVIPMTLSGMRNVSPEEKSLCLFQNLGCRRTILTYDGDHPRDHVGCAADPGHAHGESDQVQSGEALAVGNGEPQDGPYGRRDHFPRRATAHVLFLFDGHSYCALWKQTHVMKVGGFSAIYFLWALKSIAWKTPESVGQPKVRSHF